MGGVPGRERNKSADVKMKGAKFTGHERREFVRSERPWSEGAAVTV